MVICAAVGCYNRSDSRGSKLKEGVSFHKFPTDPDLCVEWCSSIILKHELKPYSRICSDHFSSEFLDRSSQCSARLKEMAVPTIQYPEDNCPNDEECPKRKRPNNNFEMMHMESHDATAQLDFDGDKSEKESSPDDDEEYLLKLSKEELIEKIRSLRKKKDGNEVKKIDRSKNKRKDFDFSTCIFRRIALKFLYLGWDCDGYVVQENTINTIENGIFAALLKTCLINSRETIDYHRCGRTDKGVSAFSQVISLSVRSSGDSSAELPYCKMLNACLPSHIRMLAWSPVSDDFSARFNCKSRTYKYWFPRSNLNIDKMNESVNYILGCHDFRNLCKMDVSNGVHNFTRSISSASVSISDVCEDIGVIAITGRAFLWHQIRAIASVLFLVGQGKESPNVFEWLLDVEKCPRKPQFTLSDPTPLNLFQCDFDDLEWIEEEESLTAVAASLQKVWTFHAIKATMIKEMLSSKHLLDKKANGHLDVIFRDHMGGKKYQCLTQRPTRDSFEEKMANYESKMREIAWTQEELK